MEVSVRSSRSGSEQSNFVISMIRMSEQGNLEARGLLYKNLAGVPYYESSNLTRDEHSHAHSDFKKEILFADWKQNDKSALKYAYSDDAEKDTVHSINMDFMVENKRDPEVSFSDTDDSPTEDLRNVLEANLNIVNASTQDLNINLSETGDDFSCKDKKKRKKKRSKGSPRKPNQIFAFNQEERKKIEQNRFPLDTRKSSITKTLCKSATFSGSAGDTQSSKNTPNTKGEKFENAIENGAESQYQYSDGKNSLYTRTISFPPSFKIVPAIRGGHEQNGLGPRPKLGVKWAPDVQEPPCSSVSHTVRACHRHQSKKKDHKHKQKLKLGHGGESVKTDEQHLCNSNINTESVPERLHSSSAQHAGSRILLDILPSRGCASMPDQSHFVARKDPLLNVQTGENDIPNNIPLNPSEHCYRNEVVDFAANSTDDLVTKVKGNFSGSDAEFPLLQDSKCASSFLQTFQGKQLSFAEAS